MFALTHLFLTRYGASLSLAPVEFAQATGLYIASLFVAFQVNYAFFHEKRSPAVLVGGSLIIAGAVEVAVSK